MGEIVNAVKNIQPSRDVSHRAEFRIPRPRSIAEFIIYPGRWSLPDYKDLNKLMLRVKNNLLFFQTNYLVLSLLIVAAIM